MYKCVKKFLVESVGNDWDNKGENKYLRLGSKWKITDDNYGVGGEIHLERWNSKRKELTGEWLEIDKEDLNKYFEKC